MTQFAAHFNVLKMIKGVMHSHLGPIWYHSEPSDIPYSPNQFLALDFFCHFIQQDCSDTFIVLLIFNKLCKLLQYGIKLFTKLYYF